MKTPATRTHWFSLAVLGAVTQLTLAVSSHAATFTVTNTDDTGDGSLRQAILDANATPNILEPDRIEFNIDGVGPHTIQPLSQFPEIIDPVVIDGYTQRGASANTLTEGDNATLMIELDGSSACEHAFGLLITAGDSTVRGLVVNRFGYMGIVARVAGANIIEGNFVGTDAAGEAARPNKEFGIWVECSKNRIGGTAPAARNLISGNGIGLEVDGSENVVQGNYIGTDASGTEAVPNTGLAGVYVRPPWWEAGKGNTIGGSQPGAGNLVSGNRTPTGGQWDGGWGIRVEDEGTAVQGNRVGTDVTGKCKLANAVGIFIARTRYDTELRHKVGGTEPGAGNLVSGNEYCGIILSSPDSGHLVEGNLIGTDITGQVPLGNGGVGVAIDNGTGCTVGGTIAEARNVISCNGIYGISISSGGHGGNNVVQGNFIGTDRTGTKTLPGQETGVRVAHDFNLIGGTVPGARNIISGNWWANVDLHWPNNVVQGNFIGTDVSGSFALGLAPSDPPWGTMGIALRFDASDTIIGGTSPGAGNVISGHGGSAIKMGYDDPGKGRNKIQGNFIGTDATGTYAIGNGAGIYAVGPDNLIGGAEPRAGNVIGATGCAVWLEAAINNRVEGNFIGTDAARTLGLGNQVGVILWRGAVHNAIGGTEPGAANTIAFSQDTGILGVGWDPDWANGNAIRGNSIYSNGALGIDLSPTWSPDGPTPNDAGDGDVGSNNLQNFPVITLASALIGQTKIEGTLNSTPTTTFTFDFYSNAQADPSGYGEGEVYIGAATVTTDVNGDVSFSVLVNKAAVPGQVITATATDPDGNTSEFSGQSPPVVRGVIEVTIDIKPGSFPNSINLGSNGTVPVAILSSATFDATTVDPTTVTLSDAAVKLKGKGTPMASLEDVNGDGFKDLVVHVLTSGLQLTATDTLAVLKGQTFDGMPIQGSDTVRVIH